MKYLRSMSMIIPAVVSVVAALCFSSPAYAGPVYRVVVPLVRGEEARAELPDGRVFLLGKVTGLPTATRWPGYTASKWAAPGTVAASAVNAVHLTLSVEKDAGRTMSILPLHTVAPAAGEKAFITLDVPAGTGFFGGWAPPVGTRVLVRKPDGGMIPLEVSGLPSPGDELVFDVEEKERPYIIDVENRPGGRVLGWYTAGPKVLARVIRPVRGVGRFGGTEFQSRGRIRANHSGVIDVSTTGRGVTGGFQVLPFLHSKSKEMAGAWQATQWLIIASETDRPLPGTAPLFLGNLVPGSQLSDVLWDIWSTYGRKPLVLCRMDGGPWEKLPEEGGKQDFALERVTHIRIYSPFTEEPQKR
ncbi:MAG: hypothetical protein PWP47_337 [Synergistaceae bacterium]|nr:hypothetical protein [Synergistaceae bacterium]